MTDHPKNYLALRYRSTAPSVGERVTNWPKWTYDEEADAGYLAFREGPVLASRDFGHGIVIDFGDGDGPIGIEVLSVARYLPAAPVDGSPDQPTEGSDRE